MDKIVSVCANCGKGEEESSNLKSCTACKLVKYCNRDCQIAHRPQHKKECKRRAKEMHDEKLFKQPPPLYGDCPICFIRLPTFDTGFRYQSCCGKIICSGCVYAPLYDDLGNEVDNEKCAFCRTPWPNTDEEKARRNEKRMEVNDPIAIYTKGNYHYYGDGTNGYQQDHAKAFELYHRAGELGLSEAYNNVGHAYNNGEGVEVDKKKAISYYELAAMGGEVTARFNLGNNEWRAGNYDKAFTHYTIAARDGYTGSLERIKQMYSLGHATKEDYTKALQLYQEYLGEIKSDQRDKAAEADEKYRYH